jgi:hypothetical protein
MNFVIDMMGLKSFGTALIPLASGKICGWQIFIWEPSVNQ